MMNAAGQYVGARDEVGALPSLTRNASKLVTQSTSGSGRQVTSYTYDTFGNPLAASDAFGQSSSTYDPNFGQLTSQTDELGRKTLYDLDAHGNTVKITRVVGAVGGTDDAVTQFTYTAHGLVDTTTDPLGRVTDYDYDALSRLITVTYAVGTASQGIQRFEYDAAGNIAATIDENNHRTESEYDSLNRVTQVRDALANLTQFTYDAAGNVATVTDARGSVTEYTYDGKDRLIAVTDALDKTTQLAYDAAGNLTSQVDPLNRTTTYRYDARNRLVETIDAASGRTLLAYDADDHVTQVTDPAGRTTTSEYDARGRLVRDIDAAGQATVYAYDAADQLISATDKLGRRTRYAYDEFGHRTTITDPLNGVSTLQYDLAGNVVAATDALGRTTRYAYDARNRLVTVTNPLNGITRYEYDAAGNRTAVTDTLGNTTRTAYDEVNRVKQTADPLSHWTFFEYDAVGNLTEVTDALGRKTGYTYDRLNRRTSTTDARAGVTRWTYDDAGQMVAQTDQLNRTTTFAYDALGRRTIATDPLGQAVTTTYDAVGNVTATTDALGHKIRWAYDALDHVTSSTDANGAITRFTYDAVGNLRSLTDPVNNTTSLVYDDLDRLVRETNQLGDSRTHVYDAVGNRVRATDRNGRGRVFTFDALDRQTKEEWLSGAAVVRTITTTYDANGQITAASDPDSSYSYGYDAVGRLTSVSNSGTLGVPVVVMTYGYDDVGNLVSRSDTIGGSAAGTIERIYDGLDRVTRIAQSGPGVTEKRVDLSYDAASQWAMISRYADLAGTQHVASSHYTYDAASRLTRLAHSPSTTPPAPGVVDGLFAYYDHTYDQADRITQVTSKDGTTSYNYDAVDQLMGADHSFQADESYTYDPNGNRTNTGYTTGANNRLLSDGTYNYEYDAEGNRTRRVQIATGAITQYSWDHRNRLVHVTTTSNGGIILGDFYYTYDVNDRRIAKSIDRDGAGPAAAESERFVYDRDHIGLTLDGAGQVTHRYLYGTVMDQILSDDGTSGGLLWPLTDHLGTLRDLVDSSGVVRNHLRYDSFGRITTESDPAVEHVFAFAGREWDDESGLYYYRARYYDPSVGRFLSTDPVRPQLLRPLTSNAYQFVLNNPLLVTDPFGTEVADRPFETAAEILAQYERAGCSPANVLHDLKVREHANWNDMRNYTHFSSDISHPTPEQLQRIYDQRAEINKALKEYRQYYDSLPADQRNVPRAPPPAQAQAAPRVRDQKTQANQIVAKSNPNATKAINQLEACPNPGVMRRIINGVGRIGGRVVEAGRRVLSWGRKLLKVVVPVRLGLDAIELMKGGPDVDVDNLTIDAFGNLREKLEET